MDSVPVGNPGNPPDTTSAPNAAGPVAYPYRMGTYELRRDMITKANSAGGLGITLSDMEGAGIPGGNGPNRRATGARWYDTAAFVNWLNTSTGHQPAYNLSGGSLTLWPSGDAWQAGGENLYRHKDAYYFLPSENEWYKAAYYDGAAGGGGWRDGGGHGGVRPGVVSRSGGYCKCKRSQSVRDDGARGERG